MHTEDKPFEMEKTFGLGVLLKLIKKNYSNIIISDTGNKFISNVDLSEMRDAVESTLRAHNICLKPN